jgi:hypothetical protein
MRSVQHPYDAILVASAAKTATGNSGNIDFPDDLDGALFIGDATTVTGTSPTMDLSIEVTPDRGTTFYEVFRFAQFTAAVKQQLIVSFRRLAEAGAVRTVTQGGTGALNANCPISKIIRIKWTIGGTNPSFTFAVACIGARGALGVSY